MATVESQIMDLRNYHEMCEPFPSMEEAETAAKAFWKELYELRNKHGIADVHAVLRLCLPDGEALITLHAGSELQEESMAAWALGQAQARREARITSTAVEAKRAERKS